MGIQQPTYLLILTNIQVTTQQHRETRSQLRIIGEPDDIPPVMDSPIVYEELNSAVAKLKLKKSPDPDCITNEMIIKFGKAELYKLLDNKSWEEGSLPQSSKKFNDPNTQARKSQDRSH